jgi:putative sporulation protein YyaC
MLSNLFCLPKPAPEIKYNIHQAGSLQDIAAGIRAIMLTAKGSSCAIVVLCIGTDRSTGDALGPLTGSKLRSLYLYPHVYGTLDEPVHAANLPEVMSGIRQTFSQPYIIAVDACLGKLENVGYVSLGYGPLKPGAAVNKDLPAVGDAYITGIVNVGGFMEHMVLQSTRLNLVVKMADAIAHGLAYGLQEV